MRKIAEEEIMRELRIAEEEHSQASEFQKTKRNLSLQDLRNLPQEEDFARDTEASVLAEEEESKIGNEQR